MKKIFPLFLIALTIFSCNLKEQIEKMGKIESDLEREFNHFEVSSIYHWGTEEGDNYLQISFYEYDMDSKTYFHLESTADSVFNYLKTYKTDFRNLEFMQVRFTKEVEEEAESFVNFKSGNSQESD